MAARSRLAILLAGLAAAIFLAWPGFSIDRSSDWRKVLAGFQLQRETGRFVGASGALIHFHGLDLRPGRIRFTLAPRIEGDAVEVSIGSPPDLRRVTLGGGAVEMSVPFGAVRDLELKLEATASSNPRPLRLSNLRLDRDISPGSIAVSLLPLLLSIAVFAALRRTESHHFPTAVALVVIAAATYFIVAACDPARAASFPENVRWIPMILALTFSLIGLRGTGVVTVVIALIGATLSLHITTVHSGFVYDDRLWARPWTLGEIASTFAGSEDPRGISGEQYRPIPSITHALDHAFWGTSPFAFHGTNMALHALSACLLFILLKRLALSRGPAFLGALTLAIHPMAASSIGWISERTDSLADVFILATFIVFLGPKGGQTLRVLSVALLALWSKETAVMLPVLAGLFALVGLNREGRKARYATLRALFGLVVLYVAIWVSLFPEKTVGRLKAAAATLQSEQGGWAALFGNLFSQLFHPIGFEAWRNTRDSLPVSLWFVVALLLGIGSLGVSFYDSVRALPWRVVALGLAFAALAVVPFRGHDAVDVYRLGHTPVVGFSIAVAGVATLICGESRWRSGGLATLLVLRLGLMATETSAAWGYPGFQFRMALRFNLENPFFLSGLTPEMRRDLERESRFVAHRDEPLSVPFEP